MSTAAVVNTTEVSTESRYPNAKGSEVSGTKTANISNTPITPPSHANYKGFVAGVFSGISKLAGEPYKLYDDHRETSESYR